MNYSEAQIIALQVRAKAIEVEVIGMHMSDLRSINYQNGDCTYVENEYSKRAQELKVIADEIDTLRLHV